MNYAVKWLTTFNIFIPLEWELQEMVTISEDSLTEFYYILTVE